MEQTTYLIVGAGISGLSFVNFIDSDDYLILERDHEIGGWCKTIKQDGFIWDFSGHFFHFRHPDIEAYLRARMPEDEVVTVAKNSTIHYKHHTVDFPFQKNIHQLPQDEFIECLYDLYFRDELAAEQDQPDSFKKMLYEKFGPAISEKFLIPYNEKLYACDLEQLDRDAMGRFFPYADIGAVIRNMRKPDNQSYNATFTYPKNGAIMYVNALMSEVDPDKLCLGESLVDIDLANRVATTASGRKIAYQHLVSSAPFDKLMQMTGAEYDAQALSYNKVLVFNLGFDGKGPEGVHWTYFPEHDYCFYRIGYYDNILNTPRMSLYVELGYAADAEPDAQEMLPKVLADLKKAGVITDQELVSYHTITLDPAYVHITQASKSLFDEWSKRLGFAGVHSIGRYGGWTYCSIEDNIVEARELAQRLNAIG